MPSESAGNRRGQAVPRTSLGISNYSALCSPPRSDTIQGRPPPSHGGGRPPFYAGLLKTKSMAGRFAPPPTVRAYARWRLLVLRTMHRRLSARRFAPSPYAGAEAPRQRPAIPHCNFIVRTPKTATTDRRSSNAASLLCEPTCALVRLRTDHCLLPTPWPWRPRQPSFPAIRPCPETSADCAP